MGPVPCAAKGSLPWFALAAPKRQRGDRSELFQADGKGRIAVARNRHREDRSHARIRRRIVCGGGLDRRCRAADDVFAIGLGAKGCVGLWVSAGATPRNAETQSSTAGSPTACASVSGAAVEQRIEARPSMLRRPSCCMLRANGSTQESNSDYAEEAHRVHRRSIDRAKRQTVSRCVLPALTGRWVPSLIPCNLCPSSAKICVGFLLSCGCQDWH
jgi:hypothetical protein